MKKHLKRISLVLLSLLGAIVAALLCLFIVILVSSGRDKRNFAQAQENHVAALEASYSQPGYAPLSEMVMTGFDVDTAISADTRLNELRFIGTHNSYKAYNPMAEWLMNRLLAPLRLSYAGLWSYGFEPLSQQFDKGIRSIELDVMREKNERGKKDGFRCAHIPIIDYASNCPDFSLALEEIALWSDHHPEHLPITVLVEVKASALSGGMLYHPFHIDDTLALEELVTSKLGGRLYTPADMLGEYESFAQLRAADDYPLLSALLGKIIMIYHYDWRGTTQAYVDSDPTARSLKMFPSTGEWMTYADLDPNQDYACFLIDNDSGSEFMEENAEKNNLLVRTRTDAWPWHADEWDAEAMASGAFILTTDYPPRGVPGDDPHVTTFQGGATVAYR